MESLEKSSLPPICRAPTGPGVRIFKVLLSIFIAYHLAAMLVIPNVGSLIGQDVSRFFLPYVNFFDFNTVWQFFSPNVTSTSYLQYQFSFPSGNSATEPNDNGTTVEESPIHKFPPLDGIGHPWDDSFGRQFSSLRFFLSVPDSFEKVFVPYLCRLSPNANGVWVQEINEKLPPIGRYLHDGIHDQSERQEMPMQKFECRASSGESR